MNIIIGDTAGFCFGVKRAVEGSLEQKHEIIYCLGELVHNSDVVNLIKEKGIKVIEDIKEVKEDNAIVIIRAHGITKEVYEYAKKRNLKLVDYTCPFVLKIHNIADDYVKKGYFIFVVGSKIHPEIVGTLSYCGNDYFVIEDKNDIQKAISSFNLSKLDKLLVIVQTTYNEEKFKSIVNEIKENIKDATIDVQNTICNATSQRQNETESLSKKVDLMIIVGGKNSSNTKKLYEIAKKHTQAILIENEKELDLNLLNGHTNIGIMAGASTPKFSIDKVVEKINSSNISC